MEEPVGTYNYETFSRSESSAKAGDFAARLRAGEEAPDFTLQTIEGERVSLSAFKGSKHVLLEFGSIT
jgi:peroxiredoxin